MARISVTKACERLLEHDDILFLCHVFPDGDTIGSAFALCRAMQDLGKRASVQCGDIIPDRYSFLFSDMEPSELSKKPYIVAVDISDRHRLGLLEQEYGDKVDLCIDHHGSNSFFAEETCLDADASATGEIVYRMLNGLGASLTQPIALSIYTAICTDTGCFRFSNVTARTHRITAKLIETGIDHYSVNRRMYETKSRARVMLERDVLGSLDFRLGGRVAFLTLTLDMIGNAGASEGDLDGLSDIPRTIEGVEVGVTFRELASEQYKISVRTVPGVDASEICARLGGGGHPAAAGCTVRDTLEVAKDSLLDSIKKSIGE